MKKEESIIEILMSEVHEYIQKNPLAADSVLGISQFWLSDESRSISLDDLSTALEKLEKRGEIKSFQLVDGTRIWRKTI